MKLRELEHYISAICVKLVFADEYCEYFDWHMKNNDECKYISIEDDGHETDLFKDCPNLTVGEISADADELVIRVLEEA